MFRPAAIVPAKGGTNGLVTDFSDWGVAGTGKWGSSSGLNGTIFGYTDGGNASTTMTAAGSTAGLHLTGKVGTWAGGGLSFLSCTKVDTFTQVRFDIKAAASACTVQMQIPTFDQRPMENIPAGGCKADGGTACYQSPGMANIVSLSTVITTPTAVTKVLQGNFSNWSSANAKQVVGVRWQFVNPGSGTCPIDVTVTSVRFVP